VIELCGPSHRCTNWNANSLAISTFTVPSPAPDFDNLRICDRILPRHGTLSRRPRPRPQAASIPHLSTVFCSWKQFQQVIRRFNPGNRSVREAQLIGVSSPKSSTIESNIGS
jgi:hypothetical protein